MIVIYILLDYQEIVVPVLPIVFWHAGHVCVVLDFMNTTSRLTTINNIKTGNQVIIIFMLSENIAIKAIDIPHSIIAK